MGPAQAIVFPQTLWDISRFKNTTYGEIEMVFQSGTHNLESASMTTRNVSGDEDIMSIALILAHMVYGGFNQDISAELVHKILKVIQQYYHMREHVLAFMCSCMVGIWINTDTKPFAPHSEFYKMLPPQARMWERRWFEQISTLHRQKTQGLSQQCTIHHHRETYSNLCR